MNMNRSLALASMALTLTACATSAGPRDDAGSLDAAHCVPLTESPPRPLSICSDNADENACRDWARSHLVAGTPRVLCIHDEQIYRCALADYCNVPGGHIGYPPCTCGHEPECGDGSLCVADTPDAEPHCQCATR